LHGADGAEAFLGRRQWEMDWNTSGFDTERRGNSGWPSLFVLQQSRTALTGSAGYDATKQFPIEKGQVQNGSLLFEISLPGGASKRFVLHQDGDVLSGDVTLRMRSGVTKLSRIVAKREGVIAVAPTTTRKQIPKLPIKGVWRVAEETNVWRTIRNPNPGYIIFTDGYFAIVREAQDITRPTVTDFDKATPEQLLAMWGPFVAQLGTYELDGDVLTMTRLVAKDKGKDSTKEVQRIRVDGNTMIAWPMADSAGWPLAKPIGLRLVRAE